MTLTTIAYRVIAVGVLAVLLYLFVAIGVGEFIALGCDTSDDSDEL